MNWKKALFWKEPIEIPEVKAAEVEAPIDVWEPLPGYEGFYEQTTDYNKIRSLHHDFDLHIKNGCNEERAAALTMHFLLGYFGETPMKENMQRIVDVMKKNKWHYINRNR
jgi:hypothetical protein